MIYSRALPLVAILCLAGCSTAPPPAAKKPIEPPKPVTGLSAIFKMFQLARTWAPDAQLLKAQSVNLETVKSEGGKAGAWTAIFVSDSLKKSRTYSFSTVEDEGLHKDVFAQQEQGWQGPTRQSAPFRMEALKTDSEKAWEIAKEKSVEFMKKNPDLRVFFIVEQTDRFPNPAWRVIWGESVSKSGYSIFVDTATGQYLQTAR